MTQPPVSQSAPPSPAGPVPLASSRRSGSGARSAAALLEASPLLLPAVLAGFSLVAMALLQLGLFRPLLVLPLGLVGAAVAARGVALTRPEPLAGPRWLDAAALLVSLGFAAVNAPYTAQNLKVFRDPATYTITGRWLQHHGSLPIPVHPEVFGAAGDVSFSSLGFDAATTPGFLHSQFSNLLPGLLAVGGWLGGDRLLLRVNVLLAAGALLALYGLARQHAGRGWALVATAALGVSLPLLYFSRNPYSEPVTLLFLAGGLALLREAQRRDQTLAYGLAGLVLGSAVLARIDGLFFLLAVPMFASVALAAAPAERRRRVAGQVGALLLGVAVPAGVAVANLLNLSPRYVHDLGVEVRMMVVGGIAVTALGVAAVAIAWRTTLLRRIAVATARWLPAAGAAAVLALAAVGASRPLWYVGHTQHPDPSQLDYIAFLQKAQRLPIEPDRTYAEQTLAWFSWYWGPVTVALAVLGAAVGVYRLLRRGDLRLVAPLGMFLSTALVYLTVTNAVPDQVNVMRRFLPVVIPGVLLAAAAALGLLARRSRAATAVAVALAVVMVLFPAGVSARVATVRDGVPQLAEVRNLCGNLPADAALVAAGSLAITYQQTFRSWCDGVPVAGVAERLTASRLRRVAASATAHDRRLHVVFTDPRELPGDAAAAEWQPISCIRASHLNAVLEHPPAAWGADQRTIYLGVVTSDGAVIPAPRSQPPLLAC